MYKKRIFICVLAIVALVSTWAIIRWITGMRAENVAVSICKEKISIENEYIKREFLITDSHILTGSILNKRINKALIPQDGSEDFVINTMSSSGTMILKRAIYSSALTYKKVSASNMKDGKKLTIFYEPYEVHGVTYDIHQIVVLKNGKNYMESFLEISVGDAEKEKAQIDYIDTDRFILPEDAVGVWSHPTDSEISSKRMGSHELMLGQPIYVNGFFMGSEFPAADTIVEDNAAQVRYYSGKTFAKMEEDKQLTTDGKFVSWRNVIGAANGISQTVVQKDFFEYIEEIAVPTEFRKQYNSWYDNMMNITDESIAASFNGAEAALAKECVEPLDSYVVDDGWNNYFDGTYTGAGPSQGSGIPNRTGFWEFNNKFPNEFYMSSALSDKFQSTFGVWVGPRGGYNYYETFAQFLEANGTGYAQRGQWTDVCVASKRYLENWKTRFVDYQKRFYINYWKWDGFAKSPCTNTVHDHMTGGKYNMYYTTDLWEKWIDVFETVREEREEEKDLFINATCYVNLSPWLLQWVNTIWLQDSADTGELGTGERHEQKIYYRDQVYYKLYKQNQIQFPMKNIYNHDPNYGVSDGSDAATEVFREYLMANAVRGTAFWELYYSPSILDEAKWKVTADVLAFAEENHEVLKNAKLFGKEPQEGVYGYSGWNGTEGIVSFTNPLDTEQKYELTVDDKVGAVKKLADVKVYQVEPYAVGALKGTISYGDAFSVSLAPHETKIFHFNPKKVVVNAAPTIKHVKNVDNNTVRVSYDQRVNDGVAFELKDNKVVSAELMEDYRTYELKFEKALTKKASELRIQAAGLKNVYGKSGNAEIVMTAYKDNVIAQMQDVEMNLSNGIKGNQEFSIHFTLKTEGTEQTILTQGDDIRVAVDAEGYLTAEIKGQTLTSKEIVTTVIEKAHGIINTSQYVKTMTEDAIFGRVNDGKVHDIVITREPNGMLKLYENGILRSSAYDANADAEMKDVAITIGVGGNDFEIGNFVILNKAIYFDEAKMFAVR